MTNYIENELISILNMTIYMLRELDIQKTNLENDFEKMPRYAYDLAISNVYTAIQQYTKIKEKTEKLLKEQNNDDREHDKN